MIRFPDTTSISTVNRQCSSGLQAVHYIAASIQNGTIDIGIGAGAESMTLGYGPSAMPAGYSEKVQSFGPAADCMLPMGYAFIRLSTFSITSENVAKQFGVTRQKQDEFSVQSHLKAAAAQQNGWFKDEIVPVTVKVLDKNDKEQTITVTQDDGIRGDTTLASLSKLKPAFSADGTTHAGNASQVSDGAAAVLLMKRQKAQELGLPIIGKFIGFATAGVPPKIMGIGNLIF